jgi:hypothetical protein
MFHHNLKRVFSIVILGLLLSFVPVAIDAAGTSAPTPEATDEIAPDTDPGGEAQSTEVDDPPSTVYGRVMVVGDAEHVRAARDQGAVG